MSSFFKALIVIALVAVVAGVGIMSQYRLKTSEPVGLTQAELDLFVDKQLGFREKSQFATDPEARKKFLERLGKQLSLVMEAERRGLGATDEAKAMEELGSAQVLQDAYAKAHPEASQGPNGPQASPEEVKAWIAAHGDVLTRVTAAIASQSKGQPAPKPEEIAGVFVMAEKAKAENLDKEADTALQLKLNHYGALIQALVPKLEEETKYSDEDVKKVYEEKRASGEMDDVHVQHILVATIAIPDPSNPMNPGAAPNADEKKKLAEDILQRIRNGEDFGALAKQFSEDPSSKEKGGDLDMKPRYTFVPEFEEAAWKLQPGEVSDVVKTDFGFHIIKMIERKPAPDLTPEIAAKLKDTLSQKRFEEAVDEIAKNNPVVLPADFTVQKPEMPEMPQMPMMDPHGGQPGAPPPGDDEMEPPPAPKPAPKAAPKPAAKPAKGGN
ncbi:MAG: peptidyl-prolyl cis-trans isomerase [Acidobacteria bacterium]|nr:peptidyl-prolyl cis-trans isomerase [Acidobacteriota bacterium]